MFAEILSSWVRMEFLYMFRYRFTDLKSGEKRAHKLNRNPRDTGRVSLGHPPVSWGFPVICTKKEEEKKTEKGIFAVHRQGVPGTPGHPEGFREFYVIFSYVLFLLPIKFYFLT